MTDVFVSYASEDRERVRSLVEVLERGGWEVWWDRQIGAGSAFDREIEKAIDGAQCIVVVWSRHSVESEWVRTEANEGLVKGNLVPVAVEDIKPPLAFRRIQTIDMSAPESFDQLRDSVSRYATPSSLDTADISPFVGRDQEKARVTNFLDRIGDQEGRTFLISGEVGVGKTRLVRELAIKAKQKGFLVLTGHCLEMDGAPPYQPLLEQISQASRMVRPENLRHSLGENAPEVAKLMPELRQQFDDIPEPPELPPDQERRYLLNGVSDFVNRAAGVQPMMLIYEDLHWADDSTCILFRYLASRLKESPVLLAGTYRDDDLDAGRPFANTLRDLMRERLVEEIALKCLDKQGVQQMIEGRARREAPPELVELVFTETEGNPFFVEEVYRHLADSGKLFDEGGEIKLGVEIKDTEVPRGVKLVIGERLDRVSKHCRTVLTVAAVVGRVFSFDVLLRASGDTSEDAILDAIEEADGAGLIEDQSGHREARYCFVHEQIRQSLLNALSFPRRQRVHLRVAGALEAVYDAKADEHAGELAYHLYQAGSAADGDKTVHFLIKAGERAIASLAFEDALRRFDSALEIVVNGDDEGNSRINRLRAEALRGMGRIDESLSSFDLAVDQADDADRDEIILARCRMLLDVWRGSEAVDDLEKLLARKQAGDDREGELEAQRWMARAYYVMSLDREGFTDKTKEAYHRTIQLARELANERTLAHALIATAQLVDYEPEYRETARANLDEADKIGRRIGDEEIKIDVATARLSALFDNGDDLYGEEVLKKLLGRRDPVRLNAHYFRMMWSALASARLERCVELCDDGIELAYRIGTLPVQYPTIKGIALLDLGRFDDALVSIGREIADEEHRFGRVLQKLGEFQYLMDCAMFGEALAKATHLIDEVQQLKRIWMLSWIGHTLAINAPYMAGDAEMLANLEGLIEETGNRTGRGGRAGIAWAHGDLGLAAELTAPREGEDLAREARRLLLVRELRAAVLAERGESREACEQIDSDLPVCRDTGVKPMLSRLLAIRARAQGDLGNEEQAARDFAEATNFREQVAKTIADANHRQAFLTARVPELGAGHRR